MTYLYYNISIRLYSSLNDFKAVTQGLEAYFLYIALRFSLSL